MDTQTETAARWYVTSTPNVGDKLVDEPAPCERCGDGDTVTTSTGRDLCAACWVADQPTPIVPATDSPTHGELVWLAATAPEQLLALSATRAARAR